MQVHLVISSFHALSHHVDHKRRLFGQTFVEKSQSPGIEKTEKCRIAICKKANDIPHSAVMLLQHDPIQPIAIFVIKIELWNQVWISQTT